MTIELKNARLLELLKHIKTESIYNGVKKLLIEYQEELQWMPTSSSGDYHNHEPLLISHIENCMKFARLVAREFNMDGASRDVFFAAIILHDIGKCKTTFKHPVMGSKIHWHEKFQRHIWTNDQYDHALWGGMIIRSADFMCCELIAELVESHMSHWRRKNPQPKDFLQRMVALCDYLATHVEKFELSSQSMIQV